MYDAAEAVIGSGAQGDGDNTLTNVLRVLPLKGDSILVLDASPPFLKLFDHEGSPLGFWGEEGPGPNELQRPFLLTEWGDRFVVPDQGELSVWNRSFEETDALPNPPNMLSLVVGCGGRLTALQHGRRTESGEERTDEFGISFWDDSTASWLPQPGYQSLNTPFSLGGRGARAISDTVGNRIIAFNYFAGRIDMLDCDRYGFTSRDTRAPETWELPYEPRGIAATEDRILVFFVSRLSSQPGTMAVSWDPATDETDYALLEGDYSLQAAQEHVWIVRRSIEPVVLGISTDRFIEIVWGASA